MTKTISVLQQNQKKDNNAGILKYFQCQLFLLFFLIILVCKKNGAEKSHNNSKKKKGSNYYVNIIWSISI